jgi:hypothetical protein
MEEPNILIKSALNDAVQKVNSGMSPTEALKKVAEELDLNPNYIQRTGEALNVALNYRHFKTASDRSSEFEIADIPKAIQEVFTFADKTAAEKISETFSVSDANEHIFNYNRALSNPMYKKAFLEISGATETNDSYATTFNTVYEKSNNYIQKLAKQKDEADVAKIAAELTLNDRFSSLTDEFKKDAGYRSSFDEFESQVFAKHGSAALPYVDLIYKTAKLQEDRGVHDSGYMMFEQCKEAALFDSLMKAASELIENEKVASEASENLEFETAFVHSCRKELGKAGAVKIAAEKEESKEETEEESAGEEQASTDPVMAEIKKKASDDSLSVAEKYSSDPVLAEAMQKEAFFGLETAGGLFGLGKMLPDIMHEHVHESFTSGFKNHGIKAVKPNLTLDNMERKLLLQELMLTDPILSKVNPAKVARAFEQLLRLSPEISKEKEVVRAELRAMVSSQALSKFDADLMAKTDVGMLKRRIATQQFNAGNIDAFKL